MVRSKRKLPTKDEAATTLEAYARGMIGRRIADLERAKAAFEKRLRKAGRQAIKGFLEQRIYRNFGLISSTVGSSIRGSCRDIDPFMPTAGKDLIGEVFDALWPSIQSGMLAKLEARVKPDKDYLQAKVRQRNENLNLSNWPNAPPLLPNPLVWFRCHLLYAWMPADKTLLARVMDRSTWPWLILLLFPNPQVNLLLWLFLLVNMLYERCEYQLTNFTVLYRASAFISIGIMWSVAGFQNLFECSTAREWSCDVNGPGLGQLGLQTQMFAMLRMLLGSFAFTSLVRMREDKARLARALVADERKKCAIKLPHAIELGVASGSRTGMRLGFVLAAVMVARGEYLYVVGRAATWTAPLTASICTLWMVEMIGMLLGGWLPIAREAFSSLCPLLSTLVWRHLPKALAELRARAGEMISGALRSKAISGGGGGDGGGGDEEALVDARAPSSSALEDSEAAPAAAAAAATEEQILAARTIQRLARGRFARMQALALLEEPTSRYIAPLTWLMLWEASAMSSVMLLSLYDLYNRIGPDELLEESALYDFDTLGITRFIAFVVLVFSDGLLLHWQVRSATYFMLAWGSLITYWPFLVVKIPLLGSKLLKTTAKTAYDQAGGLRHMLRPKEAYELYLRQQAAALEMESHAGALRRSELEAALGSRAALEAEHSKAKDGKAKNNEVTC